jgi:hypothetical protein
MSIWIASGEGSHQNRRTNARGTPITIHDLNSVFSKFDLVGADA